MKTISVVLRNNLCSGCATCASMCPNLAITMIVDAQRGVYIPKVDKNKCTSCGICYNICPGQNPIFSNSVVELKLKASSLIGRYIKCYFGHSTDQNIRLKATSGGLVSQLLIFALETGIIDGVLVTKMSAERPFRPQPFIARSRKDILDSMQSKYCPVPLNAALREIIKLPGKYAIVGLPCQIQGAKKAAQNNSVLRERLVLFFGLVCSHTPTFLATEYLVNRKGFKKEQVRKLEYRGGGKPGGMVITMSDGSTVQIGTYSQLYWGGAFASFFYPSRCLVCADKMCEASDISFMDAWLPELSKQKLGESMVIIRTNDANRLFQSAFSRGLITRSDVSPDKVVACQNLSRHNKRYSARVLFLRKLGRETPAANKPLTRVRLNDHLLALLLPLKMYISERPYLWFLIDISSSAGKLKSHQH